MPQVNTSLNSDLPVLRGRSALITGGTAGIGKACALRLAQMGAKVILVGRDASKGKRAVAELESAVPGGQISFWEHDLSLMKSVQALSRAVHTQCPRLDMLIHSAGLMLPRRTLTVEGIETVFAVQYLARFYLTQMLVEEFIDHIHVVSVSAGGTIPIRLNFNNLNGEKFYNGVFALLHESVANDLFILRFLREHPHVPVFGYGPFYIQTGLFSHMPAWFKLLTATFGRLVATTTETAAHDVIALITGKLSGGLYARHLKPIKPNAYRQNPEVQDRLWSTSQRLVADALNLP